MITPTRNIFPQMRSHLPVDSLRAIPTRSKAQITPIFNADRMLQMVSNDTYLSFVFARERSVSRNLSDDQILKAMFKTYVLGDSVGAHNYHNPPQA